MDAAEAAQEVAAKTGGAALNMLISKTSESFTFQIQTDNTAIGMAIAVGVLGAGVGVGLAALRLAEYYYGGEKKKRETRDAFGRAFGGDRPDRDVGDINRGSLLVDLHCYTAESFLEFLEDYESGKVKERLKEELSKIEIDVEHLTIKIKNLKEAEEHRRKLSRVFEDWSLFVMDGRSIDKEDAREYVEKNGISGIDGFFKRKFEKWKDVEINIGITGDSGAGKSSFINAIRGLDDEDEMAAETGVKETTIKPSCYAHPTNSKIRFWDLPGIGTPNYPDLPTYCEKVELVKYDAFLIFTAGRFTENDLELAKKIRSIRKTFFLIRTKIDADYLAEKRILRNRSFDERAMLKEILDHCCENLVDLLDDRGEIFLISNHYPAKWDFARLTQAILDVLPIWQRECLTLSLTSLSTDILQRKIQVLKGRIWMVASASAAGALVPLPGLSVAVDLALITNEISFYRSQLGLPAEGTREFAVMKPENQERVRKFFFTTATEVASFMTAYSPETVIEEASRFIPFVGLAIAGCISFGSTYYLLQRCLTEMGKTAISLLEDVARKSVDDFDIA